VYYNRVVVYIDMDVSVERASPFKFHVSGFFEDEVSNYFRYELDFSLKLCDW
jgi:hypothetical protein